MVCGVPRGSKVPMSEKWVDRDFVGRPVKIQMELSVTGGPIKVSVDLIIYGWTCILHLHVLSFMGQPVNYGLTCTVELQWLEHLWDHENYRTNSMYWDR